MKTCKVKPPVGACISCFDETFDGYRAHCLTCSYNTERYELVDIKPGALNDYAIVQKDGKITKVDLNRIYDVMEDT